jgi:hypothetical protein
VNIVRERVFWRMLPVIAEKLMGKQAKKDERASKREAIR